MDRFIFDLQLFSGSETNIFSGKATEIKELATNDGNNRVDSFTNVGSYVKITGDDLADNILSTGSHNVTVDALGGNDAILVSATKYASISGGDGVDSIDLFTSEYVTVEGGAGADVINVSDSDSISVDGGDDNDTIIITEGSKNVTVTTGAGNDTIKISSDSKNVVLTDLGDSDTIVLTALTEKPRFATFNDGVLNLDGVKVTLSGSINTDTTTTKIAFGDGTGETVALNKLLKKDPPLWNAKKNAKIATYSTASGQLMASLSGLKAFTTAYTNASDIPGITVDVDNNIIFSNDVLNKTNVLLESKDFRLALDDEEVEFSTPEKFGLAVTGNIGKAKTAKYTTKAKSDGYYVGDDGKKLKYVKANATATAFTIGNLETTTTTVAAGAADEMTGVTLDLKGPTGTVTISDEDIFADVTVKVNKVDVKHKKATIDGEDVKFIFTSGVDSLEVAGGKNDENIVSSGTNITLSTAAGNDWVYDYGSKNKLDLGAGNDYVFGDYSTDTVLAGAGNDYIQVSGESNTILAAGGNDTIEIAGGTNNTINADANNDFVFYTDTQTAVSNTTILAGAGNDTVSVVGGSAKDGKVTYKFTDNEIDLGAGQDVVRLEYVSDTTVIATGAKAANKNANGKDISFSNVVSSKVTLGDNNDVISVVDASDTSVFALGGNDTINVKVANYLTFDGGAGVDVANFASADVSSSTFVMGAGADSISIIGGTGTGNIIDTGADSDFILISDTAMTNSTISTGYSVNATNKAGDVVSIVGGADYKGNVLYYGFGTGNDTIYGFTVKDKLFIAQSDFDSSEAYGLREVTFGSGDDTVKKWVMDLTVGAGATKGTITLVDFTDTTTTNIVSGEAMDSQIVWTVTNGTATGKLNGVAVATITNLKVAASSLTGAARTKAIAEQNAKIAAAISDDGNKIIIGNDALDSSTAVIATKAITLKTGAANGYKLALGGDVGKYGEEDKGWDYETSGTTVTATCKGIEVTDGFEASEDGKSISYKKGKEVTLPVVTGLPSGTNSGVSLSSDGKSVILSADALPTYSFAEGSTDTGITISSGFKLDFADGVDVSKAGKTSWKLSVDDEDADNGDLTMMASYDSAYTNAGYYLTGEGTGISWRPETTSDTLLTISGLKVGTYDLAVDDKNKTITIPKAALASKTDDQVTIALESISEYYKDYKLALGSGITAANLADEGFKVIGADALYQTRKVTKAGYALSEDKKAIDYYAPDSDETTVFTLSGVNSKTSATNDLKYNADTHVITVNSKALNKTDITLEIGENFTTNDEGEPITYSLALGTGISAPKVDHEARWETVSNGVQYVLKKNTEGYELNAASDTVTYTAASGGKTAISITGLDSPTTDTGTIQLTAPEEGISNSDTVVLASDKIKAAGASVTGAGYNYQLSGDGGKIVYNKGAGATFTGTSGVDSLIGYTGKDTLYGGDGNDYLSGGAGNDYLDGGDGDDKLEGGNGNDKLFGGAGTNILSGGNGNDTLTAAEGINTFTGGTGKDLFIHMGGETTITDYAAGTDKIHVSNTAVTGAVVEGKNDVKFTFAEGNTITVKNGKNKWITLTDGTNTVKKRCTTVNPNSGLIAEDVAEVWFDDDNEFATADSLANITDSELVGEFENYDSDGLTKEEALVTYGG